MDDKVAAIRRDLARYHNLLTMNNDERICAVLRAMIGELDGRLRALEEGPREPALPPREK